MARKPNRKPSRHKPASIGQRKRADARRAGSSGDLNNRLDYRVDKAQALWRQNKFDEAIWYYERALARNPLNSVLLVDVARAYALRYRFAEAEKLIAQASSLYPNDATLQALLGETYSFVQQYDRAIDCYCRSLELAPDTPKRSKILLELAQMYERLHDLDAARRCAEEVVAAEPANCKARYVLATIVRRAGDVPAAEASWNELVSDKQTRRDVAADSYYQLAAVQDKSRRFEEAFASLTNAKKILSGVSSRYADDAWEIGRASGKMIAALTAEHCERWAAAAGDLAPLSGRTALLTSHPRSGTTLLEEVLDSHPDAVGADEFQVMPDLVHAAIGATVRPEDPVIEAFDRTTPDRLNELRQAYWKGMEGAVREPLDNRVLVDKNPELTMLLPLVARAFPDMKILFALRDPRDVIISCFMQQLPLNPVSVHYLTLEGTVKKYVRMMHAWLKLRGILRNSWIEVRYEDMVADLEGQARKVLDFLGLPWNEQVLEYHQRAQTKHVHSPTYESVTKPVYSSSVARWKNYEKQLAPYQDLLQPFVKAFGYE